MSGFACHFPSHEMPGFELTLTVMMQNKRTNLTRKKLPNKTSYTIHKPFTAKLSNQIATAITDNKPKNFETAMLDKNR
jgi:hypothetical protein